MTPEEKIAAPKYSKEFEMLLDHIDDLPDCDGATARGWFDRADAGLFAEAVEDPRNKG